MAPTNGLKLQLRTSLTTILGCCWMVLAIYSAVRAMEYGWMSNDPALWWSLILSCLIAWAVIERKRWGRISLQGLALANILQLLFAMLLVADAVANISISAVPWLPSSFHVYGRGMLFGVALSALSVISLIWFRHPEVVAEFETGKQRSTRKWQLYIAYTLVFGWLLSLAMSHDVTRFASFLRHLHNSSHAGQYRQSNGFSSEGPISWPSRSA